MFDLPDLLRQRLTHRPSGARSEWEARPAAVLVPLYKQGDVWNVLFTRRTDSVEDHRGQVSFPGGLIEAHDKSPEQAALREAEEEIGIRAEDVQILGTMASFLTITQFIISPVVGTIPWPYNLRLNREEVAVVFGVPIEWLADPGNLEIRQWQPPIPSPSIPIHFFRPYEGEVIWGATARITLGLLELLREPDSREDSIPIL